MIYNKFHHFLYLLRLENFIIILRLWQTSTLIIYIWIIMTSQCDVINETMVSDVQQWQHNFIIVLVFNCHCVLTEKNSPGIYWMLLVCTISSYVSRYSRDSMLHTLVSVWWISIANAGRISRIISTGGGGSLLRQRFTMTHVTFLRNESGTLGLMKEMSGLTMPRLMT